MVTGMRQRPASRLTVLATLAILMLALNSCAAHRAAPVGLPVDATGLTGAGMVRVHSMPLPGADADGVGRVTVRVGGRDRGYLLAPARRVPPRMRPALLIYLPSANTLLRDEYVRYPHSAGARLAWRLACDGAFGAAAVVAVAGTLVSSCPALSPPAFLAVNGGLDANIPVNGSTRVVPLLGIAPPSVRDSLRALAVAGGCQPIRDSNGLTDVHGCRGGRPMQLQVLARAGHGWADLDGTGAAARFLHAYVAGIS